MDKGALKDRFEGLEGRIRPKKAEVPTVELSTNTEKTRSMLRAQDANFYGIKSFKANNVENNYSRPSLPPLTPDQEEAENYCSDLFQILFKKPVPAHFIWTGSVTSQSRAFARSLESHIPKWSEILKNASAVWITMGEGPIKIRLVTNDHESVHHGIQSLSDTKSFISYNIKHSDREVHMSLIFSQLQSNVKQDRGIEI